MASITGWEVGGGRGVIQNIKPPASPWVQIFVGRSILIKIKLAARICVALCNFIFNRLAKFDAFFFPEERNFNLLNYFLFYYICFCKLFRPIAFREMFLLHLFSLFLSFCGAKVKLFHHCHANKSVCLAFIIIARLSKTSSCHRYN